MTPIYPSVLSATATVSNKGSVLREAPPSLKFIRNSLQEKGRGERASLEIRKFNIGRIGDGPPLKFSLFSPTSSPAMGPERFENEPPTEVLSFLYVGNVKDSLDVEQLRKLKIGYILSVMGSSSGGSSGATASLPSPTTFNSRGCTNHNNLRFDNQSNDNKEFKKLLIPVSDSLCENLAPHFSAACDFIDEARNNGSKVLIHCQAGISRSPTFAIAYLMKYCNYKTHEAYSFVKKLRGIISPNLNFMGQLIEFESKLKGLAGGGNASSETESSVESATSLEGS